MTSKNVGGRPPKDPQERLVSRTIRLTPPMWEKIDKNGIEWLRKLIKRARPPQS